MNTIHELVWSLILLEKNCKFSLRGYLFTPQNWLLSHVSVRVLLSAYRQIDKILSQWPFRLTVQGPRMCFCHELQFAHKTSLKVIKIFVASCTSDLLCCWCNRGSAAQRSMQSEILTCPHNKSADWQQILFHRRASAYTVVVVVIVPTTAFLHCVSKNCANLFCALCLSNINRFQ